LKNFRGVNKNVGILKLSGTSSTEIPHRNWLSKGVGSLTELTKIEEFCLLLKAYSSNRRVYSLSRGSNLIRSQPRASASALSDYYGIRNTSRSQPRTSASALLLLRIPLRGRIMRAIFIPGCIPKLPIDYSLLTRAVEYEVRQENFFPMLSRA
jgi:hypothetical protein